MSLRNPVFLASPTQREPEFWITPAEVQRSEDGVAVEGSFADFSLLKVLHEVGLQDGVSVEGKFGDFSLRDIFNRTSVDDDSVSMSGEFGEFSLRDVLKTGFVDGGGPSVEGEFGGFRLINTGLRSQVHDEDNAVVNGEFSDFLLIGD